MIEERVRVDVIRFAGYAAVLCGGLLILQMIAYRIAGANIYTDTDWPTTFARAIDHRSLFTLSGGVGALAAGCTIPLMAGFYYTLNEEDRPYCLIAFGFLTLYAGLEINAYAHYGNLVGTAIDYANHMAPPATIVEIADATVGDQFEIMQYGAFVSFGIGLMMMARLMLRSAYYAKPLSWFTFCVGLSSFGFVSLPILFTVGRLTWTFFFAFTWLRSPMPETDEEAEAVVIS